MRDARATPPAYVINSLLLWPNEFKSGDLICNIHIHNIDYIQEPSLISKIDTYTGRKRYILFFSKFINFLKMKYFLHFRIDKTKEAFEIYSAYKIANSNILYKKIEVKINCLIIT